MSKQSFLHNVFKKEIRIDILIKALWQNKQKFVLPMGLTLFFGIVYAFSLPRYYTVKVMLAPEYANSGLGGNLGNLASMVGINTNNLNSNDAIIPWFYPEVIQSTDFIVRLFHTKVETKDHKFKGTMQTYLTQQIKYPWWSEAFAFVADLFKSKKTINSKTSKLNPFQLSKEELELYDALKSMITCTVDKKTDIITISVTTQDPLVTAQFANIVKNQLQGFITDYRTKKVKHDLQHLQKLHQETYQQYLDKQLEYTSFAESHRDISSPIYKQKEVYLENEMQQAYTTYNQVVQQINLNQAKLLAQTPAFTTIQNAFVPQKPAGPKRLFILISFLFLAFLTTSLYICKKLKFEDYLPQH